MASLPDSGVVVRLTRGRLWIAILAALLVGIVALNVLALSLNSSSSDTARALEQAERNGSALRAQLAKEHSSRRVQSTAAALGLIVPEPGSIRYLRPSAGDAAEAARRLRSGELVAAPATAAAVEAEVAVVPAAPAPEPAEAATEIPAAPAESPAPAARSGPAPASQDAAGGLGGGGVPSP